MEKTVKEVLSEEELKSIKSNQKELLINIKL